MKYPIKRFAPLLAAPLLAALLLAALLLALSACTAGTGSPDGGSSSAAPLSSGGISPRQSAALDLTGAAIITLSGTGASVEGSGASVQDGVVTITAAGVYAVSGCLEEGRIIVNAPKEEVTIALNGADITCSYGSPLYIYKAGTATVHLVEGTENALTDGVSYTYEDEYSSAADEEPNACLYSKADLIIEGAGALAVNGQFSNGITSKDTLRIYDGTISVSAVNNGINGKDSNTIDSAVISVTCGGDAIRSTNDTDPELGWVSVSSSVLELTAGEDGIQAETALTMSQGSYLITSGGGSGVQPSDETSAKGLKAGTALTLTGGSYTLDCSDDAVHSNGDVTVSGGSFTISTGDDAFHADEALTVSGGEIDILTSYEGLEGTSVTVSGGVISVISSDDGVNAAGGADSSGFGGFGRGNSFGGSSEHFIEITGGHLVVTAGGDGLDSNGNTTMSGGTVIVASTGQGDGALDFDGTFTLSGGTLLAVSGGGMPQAPSQASQYTLSIGFDSPLSAGTLVSLAGEDQSFVFALPIDARHMVFSSPELKEGGSYTLSSGGTCSGPFTDGICSGGEYSGGTQLTQLTLSDYLTSYGSQGIGGRPGGGMGGPRGDRNQPPETGDMPGTPPDGAFPGGQFPDGQPPEDMRGGPRGHDRAEDPPAPENPPDQSGQA